MNRIATVVTSVLLALGLACLVTPAAHAQQETGSRGTITAQALMQDLANYGVWMSHPKFGWVWQPHDVQPWWQPFIEGEWIVTQDGSPYWRSAYPFGWATEHYGAWTYDERKGWLWVPGNEWSAAPVSWRAVDGIVGWAPPIESAAETQSVECPQPTFAWIFVRSDRLFTTSNFEVAEKELMSDEAHGTWGAWARRAPPPSNLRAFGLLPPIHSKPSVAKAPSVTQLIGLLVVVVLVSFLVLHSLFLLLFFVLPADGDVNGLLVLDVDC